MEPHHVEGYVEENETAYELGYFVFGRTILNLCILARKVLGWRHRTAGVLYDALTWIREWVETEVNSANDNPIFDPETGHPLMSGNFYGGHIAFAMDALERSLNANDKALIMLEYSDNRPWVEEIGADVSSHYPAARIVIHPLSLTSGAHMGPETWAVAFLPDMQTERKQ